MRLLGLLGNLFGGVVEPGLLVQADRCLRANGSDCRECVSICPAEALLLGPADSTEAPMSVLSQCTDCGLCAAVCPSGAITGVGVPARALTRHGERQSSELNIVCAPAGPQKDGEHDQAFTVSCLAAVHPETVVATSLALQPKSTLTLTRAECSRCPSAQQARVEAMVQQSTDLLERLDDNDRRIVVKSRSPESIDGHPGVATRPTETGRRGWSRRELFTAGTSSDRTALIPAVTAARGELLRHSADPSSVPLQLTHPIDAEGCTFCHACTVVCPTQALRIGRLPAGDAGPGGGTARLALAVDPAQCVGCGRCSQVCVEEVLTLGFGLDPAAAGQGRVGGLVVIARGARCACQTCQQPLGPGEQGVCRRCESTRTLVADVLAQ